MESANTALSLVPDWIRGYDRARFRGDVIAGVTVGVVLVPQGMAYALLAGVPPVYGLYASLIPLLIYSLLGTSRHLAVGVVAIDSLIVAAGIALLAPTTTEQYLGHVFTLAIMVGVIQIIMGSLRFGFVVNLLSRPVITGFTAAAALIIGMSQLKHLLGIGLERNLNVFILLTEAVDRIGETHLLSFAIGAAGILILILCRKVWPKIPGPLVAVVMSALAVILFNLDQAGVAIVGTIPAGLPSLSVPAFSMDSIKALMPIAITLSLIQFMGVISLGKVFAAKHSYRIFPNRELVVLGTMNVAGAVFQSIPVSGSFSRSAVNERSGAQTPFSNAIAALLIGLVLLFFTPLFYSLPIPIFASIIMVSAFGLIDVREVRYLLTIKAIDGVLALLTFAATLTLGIHQGVLVGVGMSVIVIMYCISFPNVAILGRLPGSRSFRNILNHPEAEQFDDILLLRVDASFSFANADRLRDVITREVGKRQSRAVILDASSINDLDTTALAVLADTHSVLKEQGVGLYIGGAKTNVLAVFKASGLAEDMGEDHFFLSPHRALTYVLKRWGRDTELDLQITSV